MRIDFHTHGKLAKKLPFSSEYTDWLFQRVKSAGLDAICMTEHFNTWGFDEIYEYIANTYEKDGDTFLCNGVRIFPGMETDIAEGGHMLSIGPMDAILELNQRLEPYKEKGKFLPFAELMELYEEYPLIVGAGHPFREGGHIPEQDVELLKKLDFLDLNGKDLAVNPDLTKAKTYWMSENLKIPVVTGSDTHQAFQYGCVKTIFEQEIRTVKELKEQIAGQAYTMEISPDIRFQVMTAATLKKALKEIHRLGGDYVSILLQES